ncbi:MAG TPA: DUF6448 family protein [Vicinamibacterales bacterium]|nr:DUF6448 family protein [Vicinamibacterales bacterium]
MSRVRSSLTGGIACALFFLAPAVAGAHCDSLNGPVVAAARAALEKADVTPTLRWVQPSREPEIRAAFDQTLAVRRLGPRAQQLADTWFFETLVRIHREGEGAPFTGLKAPDTPVPPGIAAADRSVESGSDAELVAAMRDEMARALRERFVHLQHLRKQADASVAAGREFVHAYTEFIHYVEALHEAVAGASPHVEK